MTADRGGSNGYRVRLRRFALQQLADESTMAIQVSEKMLADLALERNDFHGEWNYRCNYSPPWA